MGKTTVRHKARVTSEDNYEIACGAAPVVLLPVQVSDKRDK